MGRIIVHLHGRPKQTSFSELIEMYRDRLKSRNLRVEIHSDKLTPQDYQESLMQNNRVFFLDEKGSEYSSIELSKLVSLWALESDDIHLALGPVDGWPQLVAITKKNTSVAKPSKVLTWTSRKRSENTVFATPYSPPLPQLAPFRCLPIMFRRAWSRCFLSPIAAMC